MTTLLHNIVQSRAGGAVQRCHGIRHQGSYSNAEHQWGVTALLYYLYPDDYARLSAAALFHDVAEAWVGDIPAPTLRHVPGLRPQIMALEGKVAASIGAPREDALTEEDHAKIKACDRLELLLWCKEQAAMGNSFALECEIELCKYLDTAPMPGAAAEVYTTIKQGYNVRPIQAGVMEAIVKQ